MKSQRMLKFFASLSFLWAILPILSAGDGELIREISVGFRSTDDLLSGKQQEYRDLDDGVWVRDFLFERPGEYKFSGKNLLDEDLEFNFLKRFSEGRILEIDYNQIPHNYNFDVPTLHSGIGGNVLTIDDALQTAMEGAADNAAKAVLLNNAYATALKYDQGFRRDQFNITYKAPGESNNWKVEIRKDKRDGTKSHMIGFHRSYSQEFFYPVNWDTTEFVLTGEHHASDSYFYGEYYLSRFDNAWNSVTIDNYQRMTDAGPAGRTPGQASTWRMALEPDNEHGRYTIGGSWWNMPKNGRLNVAFSRGTMKQDERQILPWSTHSGVNATFASTNAFDLAEANIKIDIEMVNITYSMEPWDKTNLRFGYREFEHDNKKTHAKTLGYYPYDSGVWSANDLYVLEPTSYRKKKKFVEFDRELTEDLDFGFTYTDEDMHRVNREVADQDDQAWEVSLTKKMDKKRFRIAYESSERDHEVYDYEVPFLHLPAEVTVQNPWLRKYDEAKRDRTRLKLSATFFPKDNLTWSVSYATGEDDFHESIYGVQSDENNLLSLDIYYEPSENTNWSFFYVTEEFEANSYIRDWSRNGTFSPHVQNGVGNTYPTTHDFRMIETDEYVTYGVTLNRVIKKDKVHGTLSWVRAESDGTVDFIGPQHENQQDWLPVDDIIQDTLDLKLTFIRSDERSIDVGVRMEEFTIKDFNYPVPNVVQQGANFDNVIYSGAGYPTPWDATTVYLAYRMKF